MSPVLAQPEPPSYYASGLTKSISNSDHSKITFYPPSRADQPDSYYLQATIEQRSTIITEPVVITHGTYKVTCSGNEGTILPLVKVMDFRGAAQTDSPWLSKEGRELVFGRFNGVLAQIDQFKAVNTSSEESVSVEDGLILAAVCGRRIKERYSIGPEDMR